ncbi:MAG TPA: hypothetical protein VMF06_25380 [Candidatus Limnocylindria bacterium]|jgi:hypothetical protein|nr:hypothetical protein [Candidatus Limnocylindria bacterium]
MLVPHNEQLAIGFLFFDSRMPQTISSVNVLILPTQRMVAMPKDGRLAVSEKQAFFPEGQQKRATTRNHVAVSFMGLKVPEGERLLTIQDAFGISGPILGNFPTDSFSTGYESNGIHSCVAPTLGIARASFA